MWIVVLSADPLVVGNLFLLLFPTPTPTHTATYPYPGTACCLSACLNDSHVLVVTVWWLCSASLHSNLTVGDVCGCASRSRMRVAHWLIVPLLSSTLLPLFGEAARAAHHARLCSVLCCGPEVFLFYVCTVSVLECHLCVVYDRAVAGAAARGRELLGVLIGREHGCGESALGQTGCC